MALSYADSITQLKYAVRPYASLVAQALAKLKTAESDITSNAAGERFTLTSNAMKSYRNQFSSVIGRDQVRSILLPALLELADAVDIPGSVSVDTMFDLLETYFAANSKSFKSRDINFGTISSITGTGTGSIYRLLLDRFGNEFENIHVEAKRIECLLDQTTLGPQGRHNEYFKIQGQPEPIDNLDEITFDYSGRYGYSELNTCGTGSKLLQNGNLTTNNTSGSITTMFQGWTLSSLTGVSVDTTNVHIADYGLTPASLKVTSAGVGLTITQRFLRGLDRKTPYLPFLAYNRQAGAAPAGTQITIAWGSKSQTLTLGGAETGWNLFVVDRDSDLWCDNFYEDQIDFVVSVPTLASGYLNISFIHFEPLFYNDGCYYIIIPGTTSFKRGDYWTVTDAFTGSDSILQRYIVYAFNRYLPHSGSPSEADPTLP